MNFICFHAEQDVGTHHSSLHSCIPDLAKILSIKHPFCICRRTEKGKQLISGTNHAALMIKQSLLRERAVQLKDQFCDIV